MNDTNDTTRNPRNPENNYCDSNSRHVPSRHVPSRPSLLRTLEEVKEQVEYECFARYLTPPGNKTYTDPLFQEEVAVQMHIDPLYKELCLIIAEIYVKPPESIVRIRGEEMEAAIVQEVYRELRNEHLLLVAENFKAQTHLIHRKTPYLQTALYNVLFEFDAHYTNLVKHDLGI